MKINSSASTDVGRKRKVNEDSVFADSELGLFVVCDGMGGHSCGDMASQTAVEVISASVAGAMSRGKLDGNVEAVLVNAVELANQGIWEISNSKAECRGMGTTVVSVIVDKRKKKLITAHAGDSRVYRLRGENLDRLTTDHSLVEEQLAMGLISKREAEISTQKNVITRALGQRETVEVASSVFDIEDGDLLLLCSDGLNNMVTDSNIKAVVTASYDGSDILKEIASSLVELANSEGGRDNISVVLASINL